MAKNNFTLSTFLTFNRSKDPSSLFPRGKNIENDFPYYAVLQVLRTTNRKNLCC